jgi:hypothetical protein
MNEQKKSEWEEESRGHLVLDSLKRIDGSYVDYKHVSRSPSVKQ